MLAHSKKWTRPRTRLWPRRRGRRRPGTVRAYVKQFKQAGLVVRLFDADNQQIAPGGTVAFVLVHAKFQPTLADAAALVARGGRLKEDPLLGAFLAWKLEETGPEDALVKTAQEILSEPRKGKSRSKPADSKKR